MCSIVTREIQCTMYMHALITIQIKRMCPTFIMCSRKRVRWSFLLTNTLIYMPGLEYWGTGSVSECVCVCVCVCVCGGVGKENWKTVNTRTSAGQKLAHT